MAHDRSAAHFLNVLIPASFQILLKVLYLLHGIALNLRGKPKRHAFLSLSVKCRNTKRKIYDPLNMRKAPRTRPGLLDRLANEPPKVLRACGMQWVPLIEKQNNPVRRWKGKPLLRWTNLSIGITDEVLNRWEKHFSDWDQVPVRELLDVA
jgi:hypothetical protein